MLAFVPMPFVDRGAGPVHLGPSLLVASRLAPDLVLLVDEGHFAVTALPYGETIDVGGVVFQVLERDRFEALPHSLIPAHIGHDLRRRHNAMSLMRSLLTEVDTALADWYHGELVGLAAQGLKAVLTWCNLPSLEQAAQRCGLPVIHIEVGPLRPPFFMASMYFDFVGVNGHTGAAAEVARYLQGDSVVDWTEDRWCWVADRPVLEAAESAAISYDIGVALQVETDSNSVAFSYGIDATALVYRAWAAGGSACRLLVRDHPSAHFRLRGFPFTDIDDSAHSLAFIGRCQTVHTVNSSVGFEAEFVGRQAVVHGDSPLRAILGEQEQRNVFRSALFFAYLTPASLALDAGYISWRLGRPTATEIARTHRDHLRLLQPANGLALPNATPHHSQARSAAADFDSGQVASQWLASTSIQRRLAEASKEVARLSEAVPQSTAQAQALVQAPFDEERSESERSVWEQRGQQAESHLAEQHALLERMREGNERLHQQCAAWETQAAGLQAVIEAQRTKEFDLIDSLEKTREGAIWLEQQRAAWEAEAADRQRVIEAAQVKERELAETLARTQEGAVWLEQQRAAWEQRALAGESSQTEQEAMLQQLRDSNAQLAQQRADWERSAFEKALALDHSRQTIAALDIEQKAAAQRHSAIQQQVVSFSAALEGLRGDHAALLAREQTKDRLLLDRDREVVQRAALQQELTANLAITESRRAQLAAEIVRCRQQLQGLQDGFDEARRDWSFRQAEFDARLDDALRLIHSLTPASTVIGSLAARLTRLSQRMAGSNLP